MSDVNEILHRGEAARTIDDEKADALCYARRCLDDVLATAEWRLWREAMKDCHNAGCTPDDLAGLRHSLLCESDLD